MKSERITQLRTLQNEEHVLCDQLCLTPYYIPSGSIPSGQQLDDLKVGTGSGIIGLVILRSRDRFPGKAPPVYSAVNEYSGF